MNLHKGGKAFFRKLLAPSSLRSSSARPPVSGLSKNPRRNLLSHVHWTPVNSTMFSLKYTPFTFLFHLQGNIWRRQKIGIICGAVVYAFFETYLGYTKSWTQWPHLMGNGKIRNQFGLNEINVFSKIICFWVCSWRRKNTVWFRGVPWGGTWGKSPPQLEGGRNLCSFLGVCEAIRGWKL